MRRRHLLWLLFALPALLVLLGTLWLAVSPAALDWLAGQVATRSGGQLRIEGVAGSLRGALQAERIIYRQDELTIAAEHVELAWSPWLLLTGRLQIDRLAAGALRITGSGGDEPSVLPPSLAPPLPLTVRHLAVDSLQRDSQLLAQSIRLSLDGDAQRWQITALQLVIPAADETIAVDASTMEIATAAPHALRGEAKLAGRLRGQDAQLRIAAAGTLAAIDLDLQFAAGAAKGKGRLELAPFGPQPPLGEVALMLEGIDPGQWQAEAPRADLSAELRLQADSNGTLTGDFAVRNAAPGPLDRERLPLAMVSGRLAGRPDAFRIDALRIEPAGIPALPEPLVGTLAIARSDGDWHFEGKVGAGKTAAGDARADFALRASAARLRIERLQLAAAGSRIEVAGEVGLSGSRAVTLSGRLAGIDPSRFGDYPAARLGASFDAQGHLAPTLAGRFAFALADSRYRDAALSGHGEIELAAGRLAAAAVDLALAENRLQMQGRLGEGAAPTGRLQWRLDAPRLAALLPGLTGRLHGRGTLAGSIDDPAVEAEFEAKHLALDDVPRIDAAHVVFDGKRGRHRIDLAAQLAGMRLAALLEGGLSAPAEPFGWRGQLLKLSGTGRYGFALQTPADLLLTPQRQRLANAALTLTTPAGASSGHLRIEQLEREGDRLASAGAAHDLSPLLLWPAAAAQLEGTLTLGGEWQLRIDRQLSGHLQIRREQGDLRPKLEHGPALGLRKLVATVRATEGSVDLAAEIDSAAIGRARLRGTTALVRDSQGWGVPRQAPLALTADADLTDLAWLGRLLPQAGLETAGVLQLTARAQGTLGQPRVSGNLSGEKLALRIPEQGVDLGDGRLAAHFDGDRLTLDTLELQGAGKEGGKLRASGSLPFTGTAGSASALTLDIVFEKLRALARPDRLLVIDGSTRASVRDEAVAIDGRLRVVRGLFLLPDTDALTRSEDVTVVGRSAPPTRETELHPNLDLRVDFGDDFKLGGRGLDARLAGQLRLQAAAGASPSAHGSLRLMDGRYTAYGQNLHIERGLINFVGPLDDPGLDILALRKNLPVEAGVAITGTARAPQAKLTSTPWVPDADKLSWLVLGHGLGTGGKGDLQLLATAAGALLGSSQASALQTRMAHAFGLDELSFASSGDAAGGLEATTLTLGKRLSANARISFEQALTGTGTLARFHYQLTRRLSIRTQAGSDTAADLFYTWSFD